MPITAHPFDVYAWYTISDNILTKGPFAIQNFPPVWYHYMLVPVTYLYKFLNGISPLSTGPFLISSLPPELNFYPSLGIQYVPGLLFDFVVKLPFFISDILVSFILYKIVSLLTNNKGLSEKAALLWFLNPFVIWISAAWGMWDSLTVLFSLVSIYLLIKKKLVLSAVSLAIGVGLKIYPLLFLVPIGFYLLRIDLGAGKIRKILTYYSVFLLSAAIIFIPYIMALPWFFSDFLLPNTIGISSVVANPVVAPLGYGLSYWSLSLLIPLFNFHISESAVFGLSFVSLASLVGGLILTYFKTSKYTFEKPAFGLIVTLLLSLISFFLTYRMVAEQYFIWAVPFIILLSIFANIKSIYYWIITTLALLYSILNCPLPFFFLPLTPWLKNGLLDLVQLFMSLDVFRVVILAIIGCIFSALFLLVLVNMSKLKKRLSR
jgi:hypothetical protein